MNNINLETKHEFRNNYKRIEKLQVNVKIIQTSIIVLSVFFYYISTLCFLCFNINKKRNIEIEKC